MKKLMTVLLGLSFLVGTATVTFAQEKTDSTTKKQKKSKKKKSETKTSQQR